MLTLLFGIVVPVMGVDAVKFPQTILYKIIVRDQVVGQSILEFSSSSAFPSTYQLALVKFQGLGYESQDRLYTYINQKDLSLHDAQLKKGDKIQYEVRAMEKEGIDLAKRQAYVFKEAGSKGTIDTILYTDYKVIDLLSSFLIASEKKRTGNKEPEKFNLFIGKSTRIVDMLYSGEEKFAYKGDTITTDVLVISNNNQEILRFNIYTKDGLYYPIRVSIVDEKEGTMQLIADRIR